MRDRGAGEPTSPDRNPLSWIVDGIMGAHQRMDKVDNRLKVPTVPQYDSTNFPDDAIPGQIVRDFQDLETLWIYGSDEAWHEVGGGQGLPWLAASATHIAIDSSSWSSLDGLIPSWDYIKTYKDIGHISTFDDKNIKITKSGTYFAYFSAQIVDPPSSTVGTNKFFGGLSSNMYAGSSLLIGEFLDKGTVFPGSTQWRIMGGPGYFQASPAEVSDPTDGHTIIKFPLRWDGGTHEVIFATMFITRIGPYVAGFNP